MTTSADKEDPQITSHICRLCDKPQTHFEYDPLWRGWAKCPGCGRKSRAKYIPGHLILIRKDILVKDFPDDTRDHITFTEYYQLPSKERGRISVDMYTNDVLEETKSGRRLMKRKRRDTTKLMIVTAYGKVCNHCGETYLPVLTMDHVLENGAEHRKKIGKGSGKLRTWIMTRYAETGKWPKDIQLLCYNCNIAKYRNGGVLPDELKGSKVGNKVHSEALVEVVDMQNKILSVLTQILLGMGKT